MASARRKGFAGQRRPVNQPTRTVAEMALDVEGVVDGGVRLALDAADLPSRGGEPTAGCRRSRVIGHPASASLCSPQVRLTAPVYWIPLGPCVIIGYGVSTEPVVFSVERGGQIGGD